MGIMLGNMSISNTYGADIEAPVVGILSYTGVTSTTVHLEWTAATDNKGVVGYELWMDGDKTILGDMLFLMVMGLTEGNNYAFSVKAFDAAGNRSEFSNVVNVTPMGIVPGLTDALITVPAQDNATWTLRSFDAGIYVGKQARLVIKHTTSDSAGQTYRADVQVDDMKLGSTFWDPEIGALAFERGNENSTTTTYEDATWGNLIDGGSATHWFRDGGGTVSSGTGNTSGNTGNYYFYTESSGSTQSQIYWLKSPIVTIDNSTLEVYTAQNGSGCGQIDIYLDIQ